MRTEVLTGFDPYEIFGSVENGRAWDRAPEGWSTWIHNNAACIDEFQFQRRDDGVHLQATSSGVLMWFDREGTSAACVEGDDFLVVLDMAKQIHAWCKAQPKDDTWAWGVP